MRYDGIEDEFDLAVLAVHSDTALQLRGDDATGLEQSVLSAIPYNTNAVYLHTGEASEKSLVCLPLYGLASKDHGLLECTMPESDASGRCPKS